MIIVDTSIWIEFLKGHEKISRILIDYFEFRRVLALECIFSELLQGVKNKREVKIIKEYWDNLPKIHESGLWIKAGLYSANEKLYAKGVGLIDSFIVVAAMNSKAQVWTLDKKLKSVLNPENLFLID